MVWSIKEKIQEKVRKEKNPFASRTRTGTSVVLVYPNSYSVGMGNLGFQKIYAAINSQENVTCHRCFLPDPEDLEILEKQNVPLFSYESGTSLSKYHMVAFSLTFEMDYLHVLKILELAHIPLRQEDRGEKDPFILMGGVCASFNPEPLAIFADAFAIGEGEEMVPELFLVFHEKASKAQLLKKLANIQGVYVPSGYEVKYKNNGSIDDIETREGFPKKVARRWTREVDQFPTASVISAEDVVFGDMHLVEINRGCGRHCRFCAAGYLYRPPRYYKLDTINKEIEIGLKEGKKIGFIGSACCDHEDILKIVGSVVDSGGKFSLSSLRLESIPDDLLKLLKLSGNKTLAVAPEAGTERLRSVINKPLSDEDIFFAVEKIFSSGIRNCKFYFLIGLPSERDEDIEAIPRLAKKICALRDEFSSSPSAGQVIFSVNPFVPKPFTPLQWLGMEEVGSLKKKIKRIKEGMKGLRNVKLIHESPKRSLIQALLSRGDRRVGDLLVMANENGGNWQRVFQDKPDATTFYAQRDIREDEILPWDTLDMGLNEDYLLTEFQNFSAGVETMPCPKTICYRCGDFDGM